MKVILSLGFALLTACVTPADEAELDQDIIGGQTATTTSFPTVVGLQNGNGNWFCTGVLVDKDWVLTTASCFQNNNTVQARFDQNNLNNNGGITITVAEIHKHTSFDINSTSWVHDVAVLKLAQSVTDRTPTPIHRDTMGLTTAVTQVGFGDTSNNGNGGSLHSLDTTSVDCAQVNDAGITNANDLCFNAADGNGSCSGDGGAPALIGATGAREVVGLASGGTGNSCTTGFDIYTALAAELAFIDTLVPHTTPPPVMTPPTDPPPDPSNPDPTDPRNPGADSHHAAVARGCNAGGSTGWLLGLAIAVIAIRRRRRA